MQEVPLLPLWVTLFLTIWAAVGPLAGIVVGHYLTRSWQRRQWIADNQKEEYRKVLAGLNRLNMLLVEQYSGGILNVQEVKAAMEEVTVALNTSLFITEFLEKSNVVGDVLDAGKKLSKGGTYHEYQEEYWKAINTIIASAKSTMP